MLDYQLLIDLARQRVFDLADRIEKEESHFSKKQLLISIFDTFRANAANKSLCLFDDDYFRETNEPTDKSLGGYAYSSMPTRESVGTFFSSVKKEKLKTISVNERDIPHLIRCLNLTEVTKNSKSDVIAKNKYFQLEKVFWFDKTLCTLSVFNKEDYSRYSVLGALGFSLSRKDVLEQYISVHFDLKNLSTQGIMDNFDRLLKKALEKDFQPRALTFSASEDSLPEIKTKLLTQLESLIKKKVSNADERQFYYGVMKKIIAPWDCDCSNMPKQHEVVFKQAFERMSVIVKHSVEADYPTTLALIDLFFDEFLVLLTPLSPSHSFEQSNEKKKESLEILTDFISRKADFNPDFCNFTASGMQAISLALSHAVLLKDAAPCVIFISNSAYFEVEAIANYVLTPIAAHVVGSGRGKIRKDIKINHGNVSVFLRESNGSKKTGVLSGEAFDQFEVEKERYYEEGFYATNDETSSDIEKIKYLKEHFFESTEHLIVDIYIGSFESNVVAEKDSSGFDFTNINAFVAKQIKLRGESADRPLILILDNTMTGFDPFYVDLMIELFQKAYEKGQLIILTTGSLNKFFHLGTDKTPAGVISVYANGAVLPSLDSLKAYACHHDKGSTIPTQGNTLNLVTHMMKFCPDEIDIFKDMLTGKVRCLEESVFSRMPKNKNAVIQIGNAYNTQTHDEESLDSLPYLGSAWNFVNIEIISEIKMFGADFKPVLTSHLIDLLISVGIEPRDGFAFSKTHYVHISGENYFSLRISMGMEGDEYLKKIFSIIKDYVVDINDYISLSLATYNKFRHHPSPSKNRTLSKDILLKNLDEIHQLAKKKVLLGAFLEVEPHERSLSERASAMIAVSKDGLKLQMLPDYLSVDRDIQMAAISENGAAFQYLPQDFKTDMTLILTAAPLYDAVLEYALDPIKENIGFVRAVLAKNGLALKHAGDSLKLDKDSVLEAVRQNGLALKYADETLQSDKDVVIAAMAQNKQAFKYASPNLKTDEQVVLAQKGSAGLGAQFGR